MRGIEIFFFFFFASHLINNHNKQVFLFLSAIPREYLAHHDLKFLLEDFRMAGIVITDLVVRDIRYKTASFIGDAMHTDPDYSAAYVVLKTNGEHEGHGLTFTLGRGSYSAMISCKSKCRITFP